MMSLQERARGIRDARACFEIYLANDDVARGSRETGAFKVEPIRQMLRAKAGELVEGFYQIACDDDAIVVSILVAYPDNGIRFYRKGTATE